jgi:hypothetical protein
MASARKDSSVAQRWSNPWKSLLQLGLPLAAGVALVTGLLVLAGRARNDLAGRDEHLVSFLDLDCEPPAGLSREEFLEETQYLAGLPDQLDLLAPDTLPRLEQALTAHPWVRRVRRVQRLADGGVRAEIDYREPVLWVPHPGRAVDGEAVLLPVSARQQGLPVLAGKVKLPTLGPGQQWADPGVTAAAKVLELLRPHFETLGLAGAQVEVVQGVVQMRTARSRITWGRAPGEEGQGEPGAEAKVARLLEATGTEIDLGR